MTMTRLADIEAQVQKFWSPMTESQLKEDTLLASLTNREYQSNLVEGQSFKRGDTVKISRIDRPTAQRLTLGVDSDSFTSDKMATNQVELKLTDRIVASWKFEDINDLLSQIDHESPEMQQKLFEALQIELNDFLYEKIAPTTSSTQKGINFNITGVADFNASALATYRKYAAQELWPRDGRWYVLADPSYYSDVLNAQTLTSADYVNDAPVIGGQVVNRRFGFNILEDNSRATDTALVFHPDFMYSVFTPPIFKISDLHAKQEFGYVISAHMFAGAVISNNGPDLHMTIGA